MLEMELASPQVEPSDFHQKTWLHFRPRYNIKLLLGPDEGLFSHQKEIVFMATAAWLLTGRHRTLTRNAICLAIISAIASAEREARSRTPSLSAAYMATPILLERDFFANAYWPIGGMATLARSSSRKQHSKVLESRQLQLGFSLELIRVLHLAYELDSGDRRYELGVKKAAKIVATWHKADRRIGQAQILRHWRLFNKRIALLYAASSIRLDNGRTLLQEFAQGEPSFELCCLHLNEWIGRAAFVSTILASCSERSGNNAFSQPKSLFEMNSVHVPRSAPTNPFKVEHSYHEDHLIDIHSILTKKAGRPPGRTPKT